eukprot:8641005-Pyramimonas_sp.AAC.1
MCPQTRQCVFLRGIRQCLGPLPPALPAFGRRPLRAVLSAALPRAPRAENSEKQRQNLLEYEKRIKDKFRRGELEQSDLVVVSADRGDDGVYPWASNRPVA